MLPSIVSPTAAMVTEAVAVEEFGLGTPVETARALAVPAAGAVADVVAGSAGRLAGEQAERISNAAEAMVAQDPFTKAARFRCCRPGNDVCHERGSRKYKTALYRMRINLARHSFACRIPLKDRRPQVPATVSGIPTLTGAA